VEQIKLLGLYEIAEMAGVNPSAVSNWRKRFTDFPAPVAELKSGPVFQETQVRLWLRKRQGDDLQNPGTYYDQLAAKRGDSPELISNTEDIIQKLLDQNTSTRKPGVLLGKIQGGKTRAFLGIIARAFDHGYDVAVILTKGTKSLARQTLTRVKHDFNEFIGVDQIQVFDIMSVPHLTPYELNQKLIFIVKKEDDNLDRLLDAVKNKYPELRKKKVLIIDDEADFASVSFRKERGGVIGVGIISQQIDRLRELVSDSDFLQVTATPYSLYLQPEEEVISNGSPLFHPKRPAFTVILTTHDKYVGGDHYFEKSNDPDSPAYYFYREVPLAEREALKNEDRRRLRIENLMTEKNIEVLRDAVVTFMVAGAIRRLQQAAEGTKRQKYSFLFHTEQSRKSHEWQERVTISIRDALVRAAKENSPLFDELLRRAYNDLRRSVKLEGTPLPNFDDVQEEVINSLLSGQLMITKVNSDKDIEELLDDDGQLKLRTPFNIFIGGQILDRGITINNLIAFYYGRNPNKFQQDTVLQHSRMYGARSMADLSVTRFYAPQHIFQIMRRIHEFDVALREAFEAGAHERGVYFLQKDSANRLIPCSPNKLLFSNVVSIRPGRRLLPTGFQTVSKTSGQKNLTTLDKRIDQLIRTSEGSVTIPVEKAVELLELAYMNIQFDDLGDDDRKAHIAALEHLSNTSKNVTQRGKVVLLVARDRNVARYREEGRFSNAPDTKQQADSARSHAKDIPVLMLLRQNGEESKGWRGLPFWWPVIVPPRSAVTTIFADDQPAVT
jgi:dsDNA-binding SOS-regulon protein